MLLGALILLLTAGPVSAQATGLESFNLLNHFNWGDPQTNFNSGQFGRITSQAGDPRNSEQFRILGRTGSGAREAAAGAITPRIRPGNCEEN